MPTTEHRCFKTQCLCASCVNDCRSCKHSPIYCSDEVIHECGDYNLLAYEDYLAGLGGRTSVSEREYLYLSESEAYHAQDKKRIVNLGRFDESACDDDRERVHTQRTVDLSKI